MGGILFLVKAILKIVQLMGLAERLGVFDMIEMLEEKYGEEATTVAPSEEATTIV